MLIPYIPSFCKTLVQGTPPGPGCKQNTITLEETGVPEVGKNEVLVEVRAIGLNPIDLETNRLIPIASAHIGCDFTGEVVKLGSDLRVKLEVGDRVSATVAGNTTSGRGAFTQYAKTFSDLVWKIPEELSFEEAAGFGTPPYTGPVYDAQTCVGIFAVQLAKLSGYKVIAVVSRKSSTLEKLGVKVFHYEDLGLIQGIKDLTGDKIVHVFNAMEGHNIQHGITKILQKVRKPRRIVVLSPPFLKEEMVHLFGMVIPITTIDVLRTYGFGHGGKDPDEEGRNALAAFLQKVPTMIQDGKLKHLELKFNGGLERVDSNTGLKNVVRDGFPNLSLATIDGKRIVFTLNPNSSSPVSQSSWHV